MSFHTDLVAYLRGNTTISQAFPGGIYHEFYPQNQDRWPVLVIQKFGDREIEEDQDYPDGDKLEEVRYQFDIWGESSEQVVPSSNTLRDVLRAFRGTLGQFTVQRVERDGSRDLSKQDGDKIRRHQSSDYIFYF